MNSDTDSNNSKNSISGNLNSSAESPDSHNDGRQSRAENGQKTSHVLELKVPPAVVFLFFALTFWSIDTWFPVFDVYIPFRVALVAFLTGTAVLIGSWSVWLFYRKGTTVHPHRPQETERLITSGPYKHSRNPMYLALSMVLIAWAIYLTDLLSLMLMPGFFAYITRFQIIPEERQMEEKFGEVFEDYAEKTPRWL
jgi:protein-S-isoprenylcysteine O-methyltransferase Ste14